MHINKEHLVFLTSLHNARDVSASLYRIKNNDEFYLFSESFAYIWEFENFYLIPVDMVNSKRLKDKEYQLSLDEEIWSLRQEGKLTSVSCSL